MKKSERLIASLLAIVLGVFLIVLRAKVISIALTVAGVCLIVFGILAFVDRNLPIAVIKAVVGVLMIICGWAVVRAVLYIVAAVLLIAGILILYYKVKNRVSCSTWWQLVCEYAMPAFFILIGILLLFNRNNTVDWVLIVSGVLTVAEGGILLINALTKD